jgi:hypothetical protein
MVGPRVLRLQRIFFPCGELGAPTWPHVIWESACSFILFAFKQTHLGMPFRSREHITIHEHVQNIHLIGQIFVVWEQDILYLHVLWTGGVHYRMY